MKPLVEQMTGEESSQREGYGARAAVRCTQTPRRSPAGSGESVCWEVSPCLSCFCSPSSSDWVLPTAGPGELNLRLEESIGFQVLFTRISKLLTLHMFVCRSCVTDGKHTTAEQQSEIWGSLRRCVRFTWSSNETEGCNLQSFGRFTGRATLNQPFWS